MRVYNEIKEYALAHLGDNDFMTAPNVMTQLLRLQQVLSGHTKTDEGKLISITDNRLKELMECLEDVSGKVIIWSRFRYDIERIKNELKKVAPCPQSRIMEILRTKNGVKQLSIFKTERLSFLLAIPKQEVMALH